MTVLPIFRHFFIYFIDIIRQERRFMMSKLYTKYLSLKSKEKDTKFLFKSGIFYIFLEEDAIEMSKLLNLKLTYLNDEVRKCGFPSNNLKKYLDLLQHFQVDFQIVDNYLQPVTSLEKYLENESIFTLLTKIKRIEMDSVTPLQAYELLYELSSLLKVNILES